MVNATAANNRINKWLDDHGVVSVSLFLIITALVMTIVIIGNSPWVIPFALVFLALCGSIGVSRFHYLS